MIAVNKIQARNRFQTLPSALQDAMYSVQIGEIIGLIATQNNLGEERIPVLAETVGWTLLGFLHPEDIAKELQERASIPAQTATAIANAVIAKILSPLMGELEKVYAPALHEHERAAGPVMMQDIGPASRISSQTATGGLSFGASPLSSNQTKVAAPPPAPKSDAPGAGWSRTTPAAPVVKLSQTSTPAPEPAVPRVPPPTAKPIVPAAGGPMGEFERRSIQQNAQNPGQAPAKPAGPAPIIIHEDATFKPQQQNPGFHIPVTPEQFDLKKIQAAPTVKPAFLELGQAAPAQAPKSPAPSAPRTVHYTEYAADASRQVTEFTAPPARPAMPPAPKPTSMPAPAPKPAAPPAPPKPAQNTPNKVIYKDYSAPPQPPSLQK